MDMDKTSSSPTRWLRIRNQGIGILALVIGLGAVFFGLRSWLDLLWVMPLWLFCLIFWQDVQATHPRRAAIIRRTTPASFDMEFEEVHFQARDGLKLFGYFLKGTRPEAVILSHGLGGGGVTLCRHGKFLQDAGYNVLLFDARGHGKSEGDTIDGVHEVDDVIGAVDWLRSRPGIAADRIGVLGISLGAHTLLHAALQTPIRALVLEGMGPTSLEDHGGRPTTLRRWINYPINWLSYTVIDFISDTRPESNSSAVKRLHRPLLMISTGKGKEQYFTRLLFAAANEPKELWEIPQARHAAGYFQSPQEYGEKVVKFFDTNLT
jgi:pimeloyl-ACP methyl ester carboxylesterase